MLRMIFAIYDRKGEYFHEPFTKFDPETCKRDLAMMFVNPNPKNAYVMYAHDYCVYQIGVYNDTKGTLECVQPMKFVCELASLSRKGESSADSDDS